MLGPVVVYVANGIQLGMFTNDEVEITSEVKQTTNGVQTIVTGNSCQLHQSA